VPHRALIVHLGRVSVASAVMGVAAWACHAGLAALLDPHNLGSRFALALVPVLLGIAVYAAGARLLRIREIDVYLRRLHRRR
jgi:hypothetical protein